MDRDTLLLLIALAVILAFGYVAAFGEVVPIPANCPDASPVIRAVFDRMPDRGTIDLDPGTYTLKTPLDLRGKTILFNGHGAWFLTTMTSGVAITLGGTPGQSMKDYQGGLHNIYLTSTPWYSNSAISTVGVRLVNANCWTISDVVCSTFEVAFETALDNAPMCYNNTFERCKSGWSRVGYRFGAGCNSVNLVGCEAGPPPRTHVGTLGDRVIYFIENNNSGVYVFGGLWQGLPCDIARDDVFWLKSAHNAHRFGGWWESGGPKTGWPIVPVPTNATIYHPEMWFEMDGMFRVIDQRPKKSPRVVEIQQVD